MTKNDTFFKILFAIELALLPMVIFAYNFLVSWTMGLFIGAIFLCRVWRELFANRKSLQHTLIGAIGNVAELTTLLIFLICVELVETPLAIITIVCVWLSNLMNCALFNRKMNETIEAVDFCSILFESLAIAAFTFVMFYDLITNITLFSIILTAIVSVVYKVYYVFRYTDLLVNTKKFFVNIFKKR